MSSFHNPVRITFGNGALEALPALARGRRSAIITTPGMVHRGTAGRVGSLLGGSLAATFADVLPNPTVASCTDAHHAIRDAEPELLIALGGGSALDTAKAVAAQYVHGSADWLSAHLRQAEPIVEPFAPPPILAIPTTAGTGSEVTMWGTIWDERTATKHSISHPALYAEAALLDPTLTASLPPATTIASALDALSHAMESIWNRSANQVSDALGMRAIAIIPPALRRVLAAPADAHARELLFSGSLLAGLAISNTRTALAHSISYPLTAELGIPHGIACSVTLPELLEAVQEDRPDRANLILDAMGVSSSREARTALRDLFSSAGIGEAVRRHVTGPQALRQLRGGFIAPGRAENFLLDVDQAWASDLLARSIAQATGWATEEG